MIATLTGVVSEKTADMVILEASGVGYGLFVTADDYSHLIVKDKVKVYIYEYIREQAHDLFGFLEKDTKALFEQLLAVNGVGPKMALAILSIASAQALRHAIADADVAFITQANGVGKRLAERVVVELKDKVGLHAADLGSSTLLSAESRLLSDDAVAALVSLGYNVADAAKALQPVDKTLPTEKRVTQALKRMPS